MIYLFYGSDRSKALEKALGIISKKVSEKPDAVVFKIDSENISEELLREMCSGQTMFSQKYIVHIKDVCEKEETQKIIFSFLKEMQVSENIFIITEGGLNKSELTKIEKYSEKVFLFEKKKAIEKSENIFKLSDYLIARDKKNLWITYQKFKDTFAVEEIHGTLFWAFKNIMIVAKTQSVDQSGLKPFVYSKTKKALKKYSQEELEEKFWQLTKMLSDSRRGEGELGVILERWMLGL